MGCFQNNPMSLSDQKSIRPLETSKNLQTESLKMQNPQTHIARKIDLKIIYHSWCSSFKDSYTKDESHMPLRRKHKIRKPWKHEPQIETKKYRKVLTPKPLKTETHLPPKPYKAFQKTSASRLSCSHWLQVLQSAAAFCSEPKGLARSRRSKTSRSKLFNA